jgi:hypothetical protein
MPDRQPQFVNGELQPQVCLRGEARRGWEAVRQRLFCRRGGNGGEGWTRWGFLGGERERVGSKEVGGKKPPPPTEIGRRPVHRGQGGDDGSSPRDAADDSGGGPPAGGAHRVQGGGGLEREAAATEAMRRAQWLATSATATPSASPPLPRIHLGPPGLPRPKRKCQGASG